MTRGAYSALWLLALPFVLGRLWWRSLREPGYRQHLGERLGFYGRRGAGWHTLWVHAVSVGETRAAEPLIDALMQAYPDSRIVLTHMTPTGRAAGKALYAKHGARLVQSYLPYDIEWLARRFLRFFTPRICILMETEVWPNMIAACQRLDVPVALVNARLSERSLRRGQRFGALMMQAARGITLVAAQTEADAGRVRALGSPKVDVTGSIKFDVVVPQAALDTGAWLRGRVKCRPVLLCASTREGEEALILDAWQGMASRPDGMLLAIVPRHPQRFDEVAGLVAAKGLSLQRRSQLGDAQVDADVLLGDSMGEMFAYYEACDCAFIGGSLLPLGGQNLIEACALARPVIVGQHTFNFAQATEEAIAAGGALRVADAGAMLEQGARLLADRGARATMGQRAAAFAGAHKGATLRTLELLRPLIH
ncbi:3-deoxy-D-manno-octulosonic acid transferase [Massilia sp. RP-1-19]|uniref:3-deoxy-D-manno-octulosonic acid transferase n=1 Tax=Massilia polaris TaxID=2728846 RepID=A0A848HR47_9BURK|nr:lipid IV(A) 3-deoxy-D-manno-octulosonic acid transferase [Massilia polaris]NML61068.1 3-deoxy-D-manno-octulosonic acid transferase [Massilia polaris]